MDIKIEKNVPIPRRSKYPLDKLEVGDSFWVRANIANIRQISSKVAGVLKRKFICREEKGGTRCWRTK